MRWISGVCFLALLEFWTQAAAANPCDGVDRNFSAVRAQALSPLIAGQLNDHENPETKALQHVQNARILSTLQADGWTILYVGTGVSDEAYLFYAGNPAEQHFLALWAGTALPGEEHSVESWEMKTMPHIPEKLASCFAWHVIYEGG